MINKDLKQYKYRPIKPKKQKGEPPMTCPRYAVLRLYYEYVTMHGYGPSENIMAEMTGVHQFTINRHLRALEKYGYLKKVGIRGLKWEVVRERLEKIKIDTSKYKGQIANKSKTLFDLGYDYAVNDKVILN